jgi:cation diffusion facilitator CzcD-associated flavoprotein CzcO
MTNNGDGRARQLSFNPETLHERYRAERDKRLRPDGLAQYVVARGRFAEDPYAPEGFEREPLTDSVEVAVIGGGFSGLIVAGRLRQAGLGDIRIIEKGSDFGGTWYWNRYPGIRCDVESYIYMPFLEELRYVPTEKYATGEEIFAHCQAIGKYFDLYSNSCLQTQVTSIDWHESAARWVIRTDRGDEMKAKFVCLGGGSLHRAKLPGIPGVEQFQGRAFHSSRWDYSYTGGNSDGNLTGLREKRVGVVGTGASAIQCIPHIAESAKQLVVFQRTPSAVDVRNNGPTDPYWAAALQPGWQKKRMVNFTSIVIGIPQDEDLVADRWTDVWRRFRGESEGSDPELLQLADYRKMEEIRARIDAVVSDRSTADALKPWYNLFCKRPLFSDDLLQTFNRPNVVLVDTNGRGVDRMTPTSAVVGDLEYELDCIVFATGFTVGVPPYESGEYTVTGRGGVDLAARWSKRCSSMHGILSHGFPNLFVLGKGCGSAESVNVPHMLVEQGAHVAAVIQRCVNDGVRTMEIRLEAEEVWAGILKTKEVDHSKFLQECTPGYFNNEGQAEGPYGRTRFFGGGPIQYIQLLEEWRSSGMKEDLAFSYETALGTT